jgi:tRNA (guanine-N7-)-methyltransferase
LTPDLALSEENKSERTVQHQRTIRSYVRREGRLTPAQQRAIETLWPKYGIRLDDRPIDFKAVFARNAPITLEIGFGDGVALAQMAEQLSLRDFVGIEVHRPGIGRLLRVIEDKGLSNVRVIEGDALVVLRHYIPNASLHQVLLLFPDPWPKKRHHKRRIVQSGFVDLLAKKLEVGGILHMVTDWKDYAEHIQTIMEKSADFKPFSPNRHFRTHPQDRPLTKFERRGLGLGHAIYEMVYQRKSIN